jgi:hypothetical protein
MSYSDSIGISAEFELSYENAKIIKKLYDKDYDCDIKKAKIFDLYHGLNGKYCVDGLYCYHRTMFNMNDQNATPRSISNFQNTYTYYDYTVLNAVLKGESDEILQEYFKKQGDIEKNFIICFNCISINYDKKSHKLQLELAKACIEMFKSLGVNEDNIVDYKHNLL